MRVYRRLPENGAARPRSRARAHPAAPGRLRAGTIILIAAATLCATAVTSAPSAFGATAVPTKSSTVSGTAGLPTNAPKPPITAKIPKQKTPAVPSKATAPGVPDGSGTYAAPVDPAVAAVRKARADALAAAKKSGKPVPVPLLTTERSLTSANPDGTFTVSESLSPVRAKTAAGWGPIDTTLAKSSDGRLHPKAAAADITVSAGGSGPLASIGIGGRTMTIGWPLGALPAPRVIGNHAVYPGVLPGVDLRVDADAEGVREVLIVADAKAAASPELKTLRFPVTGTGVTVGTNPSGAVIGVGTGSRPAQVVFAGGVPRMWDSPAAAPAGATAAAVVADPADGPLPGSRVVQLPATVAGGAASITPDQGLLTGPGAHYPVIIDPTIGAAPTDYAEIYAGDPTHSFVDQPGNANGTFVRAGYDNSAGAVGPIHGMFQFNVYNVLQNLPGNTVPSQNGNFVVEDSSNITSATFTLTAQSAPHCPNVPAFDLYRTGPIVGTGVPYPTWQNGGPGTSGAFGNGAIYLGTRSPSACGQPGQMSIDDTAQVKQVYTNAFNGGDGTATLGIRMAQETSANGYWSFYFHDNNTSFGNATLNITYTSSPILANLTTNPPMTSRGGCGYPVTNGNLRNTAGYINKNIGNQVTLGAQFYDVDNGEPVETQYEFLDVTSGASQSSQYFPGPANGNYYNTVPSVGGGDQNFPGATLTQSSGQLQEGHEYEFLPHGVDTTDPNWLDTNINNGSQACYFVVAFKAPNAPGVFSGDFPQLGNPAKPGMYATVADAAGFQISGTTSGVNIDHFDYVINGDSSKIPNNAPGCGTGNAGCIPAAVSGSAPAGNSASATIPVPAGATTMGTNTLWVRAVDKAGNQSPVTQYDFYLPGNPNAVPTLGDVTGDGVPDVIAVAQDPNSPKNFRLVTFPGNSDPNVLGSVDNAVEAAPASDAPDGTTWANTLITHRGALRGIAVDDLFAYSKTNQAMYYYLNKNIFGGVAQTDQFAVNQKVLVHRPACTPNAADGYCAGYAPDWSRVTQILALGNAAGGAVGTFAGRTNLITVENNGNHGAELWLFSAAPGLGQLAEPVLLSAGTPRFNWADADLIAPGATTSSGLPDLWTRDRTTGTLYQFTNKRNAQNAEVPASLGDQGAATVVGAIGAYDASGYPTLVSAGSPAVASGTGVLTQTGPPALWNIQPDGQLALLPGSANGPVTSGQSAWPASHTAWASANSITSVNGAAVTPASGTIQFGESQSSGNNQLCLDLPGANTTPGTMIQGYTCNGLVNQQWSLATDGTIRFGGDTTKCMEIATYPESSVATPWGTAAGNTSGTMTGSPVQINNCAVSGGQAAPNQHWVLRSSPNAAANGLHGWYDLYNPNSGRCLDNGNDATGVGQQMWIFDCNETQAQQWQAPFAAGAWQSAGAAGIAPYATASAPTSVNGNTFTLAAAQVGDHYSLPWYVPYEADYFIESTVATGPGSGIMQASIDAGNPLPSNVDSYAAAAGTRLANFGAQHLTAGVHTFTFTVAGKNAGSSGYQLALTQLSIGPAHGTGPVSELTATPTPTAGLTPFTVNLDASQSYPGRNQIASYAFDFGDGTTVPAGTAPTASHTYTAAGTYTASVTVTDSMGMTTTTSLAVTATTVPTGLTSSDGTSTAPCATAASSAPTMASVTPTLTATVAADQSAQFELRDLTDPSLGPPIVIGGSGSAGSAGPASAVTTPTLVNGHEYGFAARSFAGSGDLSPVSATCYFWAITSGAQATPTSAAGLPLDNTLYPANSPQTWAGPVTTLSWTNGNLALTRNSDSTTLWASGTSGSSNVLALQNDGNIVVYGSQPTVGITGWVTGSALWGAFTSGQGATALLLATDGSLTVRNGTTVLWNAPIATHLWSLGNGQGLTAADTGSPGGAPATLDTVGVSWPSANYASFAGTDRIAASGPVLDTTKSFTVAAWVNLAATGTPETMLVQQATTNSAFYLEYNGSTWQFAVPTADTSLPPITRVTSTAPATAGAWTHLIGTYDAGSGRVSLYVNGTLNSTGTVANSIASTSIFAMGRGLWNGVLINRFTGSMANVRVYQQSVSDSQAASIYRSTGFTKPQVPSIAGALISSDAAGTQQMCLDDLNGSLANSTTVIDLYGCNGTWPQAWQFAADGTVRIMGANPAAPPNKCLDTGGVNTQGSKVTLYDCQPGNGNQQWQIVPSPSATGKIFLQNPLTGMCLDNTNSATTNTNPFQLYPCQDDSSEHFTLPTTVGGDQKAEAESLWGSASGGTMQTQIGSEYSNGAQEFLGNTVVGSSITLNMYVANPGEYAITPQMTEAADYGTVKVSIDGTALPNTFDGYYSGGITTERYDFGTATLAAGMHSFTFTVTGTNPASTGNRYNAGIDTLLLQPTAR